MPWYFLAALALAILAATAVCVAAVRMAGKADDEARDESVLPSDWSIGP
jgi:hypothetical protein